MCQLYLNEQGSKVRRSGRRLKVEKDDKELLAVPIHRIDTVIVEGMIQFTASSLALLLDRGIPLILTSSKGRLRGALMPPQSPYVQIRKKQYQLSNENTYCSQFASDIVKSKADSSVAVLRRYSYNHRELNLKPFTDEIIEQSGKISYDMPIETLNGYEGIIARNYFSGLVEVFKSLDIGFNGRIKRPSVDPVNSCLSYLYVVLTAKVEMVLATTGLDTFCGFMHKPNRNAPALALDFVEQFRHPIVDRFVMLMFNRKTLTESDFDFSNHCKLKKPSLKKMISAWEEFLETEQKLHADRKTTPNQLIIDKAQELKKSVLNNRHYANYRLNC